MIILMTFSSCSKTETKEKENDIGEFVSKSDFYLDTLVDIKIYDPNEDSEAIIDKAMARIDELEKLLSVHIENSDLFNIKENAGIKPVKVSDETLYVLKKSIKYAQLSNGHFDITTGPLVDLWAIDPPNGHVPTEEELKETLPKIDYKKIIIDEQNKTVMLQDKGMIANLGAIAKGYIADEVKTVLLDNGVKHGIINLGGNVLLVDNKPDNIDFKIGVQDPSSDRGAYLGLLNAKDISIVSSGNYERYFEVDGKRYHHILDPFTGFPTENEIQQITILSKKSIDGDGLSTTGFLLGLDGAMNLIESLEDIEAIFITVDNKIYLTSGVGEQFVFDEANYSDKYEVIK